MFYLLLYFLIFSIILFYATQLHIIKTETVQVSTTYPIVYPIAPVVMDTLGTIIPFFEDMFAELEIFFDHLSKKAH
jgi:membrane protein required for colicin V production